MPVSRYDTPERVFIFVKILEEAAFIRRLDAGYVLVLGICLYGGLQLLSAPFAIFSRLCNY